MDNRFLQMRDELDARSGMKARGSGAGSGSSGSFSLPSGRGRIGFSTPFSAAQRVLVVLMENGGVDLGVGTLVDAVLDNVPGSSLIPQSVKDAFVRQVEQKVREATDNLLESAELVINRYQDAKPKFYGDVIVLRNGTAFYNNLRDTLIRLTNEEKIIDLFVLTHGSANNIAVSGGQHINGEMIRQIRSVHNANKPVRLRSVYMMNCVGSTLNQAWLDIGAKTSAGSIRNNYLPEPTMYFFFSNWKGGQSFTDAVINAYRSSIEAINTIIRTVANAVIPVPGVAGAIAEYLADIENRDFVRDSAPVVSGDGSTTISSDSLSFGASLFAMPFTVVPLGRSRRRRGAFGQQLEVVPRTRSLEASKEIVDFIKSFEGFRGALYNDPAGHCTIGYGTLVHRGACNGAASETPYAGGVSEARATELLRQRLAEFEGTVNDAVETEMNQHQFDALVSFCYNVGSGAFRRSTLLRRLNEGEYDAVPDELARWTRAGGRVLPGLVRRRAAEGRIFTSGDYSTRADTNGHSAGQSVHFASPFQDSSGREPRGVRNRNPGNIRMSGEAWEGKVPHAQNTDGTFEQFTSYAYGVRALIILLRTYMTTGSPRRNTVRRIITSWAPPGDGNHTESYIRFVLERLRGGGLDVEADTVLDFDRATVRMLAQAIARMENGVEAISDEQFEAGFALLPERVQTALSQSVRVGAFSEGGLDPISAAEMEPETGEMEDFGPPAGQMSTDVAPHCPINHAADASTDHFSLEEFASKDGATTPMGVRGNIQILMNQLEVLRAELGEPITIVSGYRSPEHNAAVGGAARSQHMCGRAADIRVRNYEPAQVHAKIEELIAAGRMMQGGLGKYASFVHYDTRGRRARW